MMKSTKKRASPRREKAAEETMIALNEMEENLRRLGLRGEVDEEATASTEGQMDSKEYIASIRKSREEAAKLRHEKEYRQYAAEEQKRENELMLFSVNKEKDLRDVIAKAQVLLDNETRKAEALSAKRMRRTAEHTFCNEKLNRQQSVREQVHARVNVTKEALILAGVAPATEAACTTEVAPTQPTFLFETPEPTSSRSLAKAAATCAYCENMTKGLVELAIRVADNQYTMCRDGSGPLRRIPQDLAVTQWNTWVEELLFPKPVGRPMSEVLATTRLHELCDPNYNSCRQRTTSEDPSGVPSALLLDGSSVWRDAEAAAAAAKALTDSEAAKREKCTNEATAIVERVVGLQASYDSSLVTRSVTDAMRFVRTNDESRLRHECDALRRQQEAQSPEEVVPAWPQRLPPAGCFVYGDDLSGARALAEYAVAMHQAESAAHHDGGNAASHSPSGHTHTHSHTRRRGSLIGGPADFPQRPFSFENDAARGEGESCHLVTPSMLTKVPTCLTGSGGAGGGGVGGGKGSKSSGGSGSGGGAGSGGASSGHATSGATSTNVSKGKQMDEGTETRIFYETLADILARELTAVHQHNVLLIARGGAATGGTPRTLLLVGFPDCDAFWRALYQRLSAAVEMAEQDMSRLLRGDEAGEEELTVPTPQPRGRGAATRNTTTADSRRRSTKITGRRAGRAPSAVPPCENPVGPKVRVFPPLSLLGLFLQYDVPARFGRLRTSTAVGTTLHHPIFAPDTPFCFRTEDDNGGATVVNSGGHNGVTSGTGTLCESCAEWTIERLRHELTQQDNHMRQTWPVWAVTIAKASVATEAEQDKPQQLERKKRSRPSLGRQTSDIARATAGGGATSPSTTATSTGGGPTGAITGATPTTALSCQVGTSTLPFPKVLIFRRREDITPPVGTAAFQSPNEVAEYLLTILRAAVSPSRRACATAERLVPGQLPLPIRLPDYKLTLTSLAQLVELHNRFHTKWTEMESHAYNEPLQMAESDGTMATNQAVWAEIEVFRAFRGFTGDLVQFMRQIFPPSLWAASTVTTNNYHHQNNNNNNTIATAMSSMDAEVDGFSRTTHFTSIDRNYESSRAALFQLFTEESTRVSAVCALLLRYATDNALLRVAETLARIFVAARRQINDATACLTIIPSPSELPIQPANTQDTEREEIVEGAWIPNRGASSRAAVETFRSHLLAAFPRLGADEALAMIEHLNGQPGALDSFRCSLRAYTSRVRSEAVEVFTSALRTLSGAAGVDVCTIWGNAVPRVVEIVFSYLFANDPVETSKNANSRSKGPSISASISRVSALVYTLRRCCIVAGRCAARWVDSMYATALAVPPRGTFPPESRPTNIYAIFAPPAPAIQRSGAPPLNLALESLSTLAPHLAMSEIEKRECWPEAEMEFMLQCFSLRQCPSLDETGFLHAMLLAQLGIICVYLPSRAATLASRLNFPKIFDEGLEYQENDHIDPPLRLARPRPCRPASTALPFVSIDEALILFQNAATPQRRVALRTFFAEMLLGRHCFAAEAMVNNGCNHLVDAIDDGIEGGAQCNCRLDAARLPSTAELRTMLRSFPPAVREQCNNAPVMEPPLTAKEWRCLQWWKLFDDPFREKEAAFIRRYMLRILTACFGFADGEICTRCVPFLPDVISIAARTEEVQATLERYFHAIAALDMSRERKLCHSQTSLLTGSTETHLRSSASASDNEKKEPYNEVNDSLMALSFTLSVPEALYFFQRADEAVLRGPCNTLSGHGFPDQRRSTASNSTAEWGTCNVSENHAMPLSTELTLLLAVEGKEALSLPLIGASHWGRRLVPRLIAPPSEITAEEQKMDKKTAV